MLLTPPLAVCEEHRARFERYAPRMVRQMLDDLEDAGADAPEVDPKLTSVEWVRLEAATDVEKLVVLPGGGGDAA